MMNTRVKFNDTPIVSPTYSKYEYIRKIDKPMISEAIMNSIVKSLYNYKLKEMVSHPESIGNISIRDSNAIDMYRRHKINEYNKTN